MDVSHLGEWSTPPSLAFQTNANGYSIDVTTMVTNSNETGGNATAFPDIACSIIHDSPPLMLSHKIYLYSSLVFMVLGLVGNALSMLVFSAPDMRIVSSNVYLLVLALSDTTYLLSVFFSKNLTYLRCFFFLDSHVDIYNRSAFFCKFLQYLQDLFSSYSTCVIMAFTLERYVAVYLPIKFKAMCTVRRARLLCLAIFVIISLFILPYHIMFIYHYKFYNVCAIHDQHEKTFTILYAIEAFIFRIIPVFVITVLNVFIIVRVSHVTKMSRRRHSNACTNNNRNSKRTKRPKDDKSIQLTVMLILVSTSYVLTYIPVLVHVVIWKLQRSGLVNFSHDGMLVAKNYASALYIAGFAINFFLYTVSGRVFRDQLEVLLCNAKVDKKLARCGGYTGMLVTAETDV